MKGNFQLKGCGTVELADLALEIERFSVSKGYDIDTMTVKELIDKLYEAGFEYM